MFESLHCRLIGIEATSIEAIGLAARYGFAGVDIDLADTDDPIALRDELAAKGMKAGVARDLLPRWTTVSDMEWDAAIASLPKRAHAASQAGFYRTMSVVRPFHTQLSVDENVALHVRRLRQAAPVLEAFGFRIGLEYVSPKTRRAGQPHPFLHDYAGLSVLLDAIDCPSVGVFLDTLHWYCANESAKTILSIPRDRLVGVHVNDAIASRSIDQQLVSERELPGKTGVINLKTFMQSLAQAGYDGPVTTEPMNKALESMPRDEALTATASSMHKLLRLAE